jgi:hypothetical protein
MPKKMNALKTGAYARDTLLPWENAEAYEELRAAIFADLQPQGTLEMEIASNIVENRWLRRRLQRTTAISTHRHAFGQKLEETGVGSWSDALKTVRKLHVDHHQVLERIANSTQEIAQRTAKWTTDLLAEKVVAQCEAIIGVLTRIEAALDEEADFFREYTPKQLDQRIGLENALDAQFDKLMARLNILREARILPDKLRGSQDATADAVGSLDDVDEASKSSELPTALDLAEMDRDDVEEDEVVKKRSSADRAVPPNLTNADRNKDVIDPLVEFLGEDGGDAGDSTEADREDDTDHWGMPKST